MSAACLFTDVMILYCFTRAVISCIGVGHGEIHTTLPVVMMPTAVICYRNFNRLCVGMYNELNVPYILESNPHPFYSFRGLKNQMRIRIACGLDSRSRGGFKKMIDPLYVL
jgi:hypothetical protein